MTDINFKETWSYTPGEAYPNYIAKVRLLERNGHFGFAELLNSLAVSLSSYFETLGRVLETTNDHTAASGSVSQYPKESSTGGRKKYQVNMDALHSFKECGFSWAGIARLYGANECAIKRSDEFGIGTGYSAISNDDLDSEIRDIL